MPTARTCLGALTILLHFMVPAPLVAQERSPFGQPIAIGGRTLWLACSGTGSPTVVLEAGHTETSSTWAQVQPPVAVFTRVCSYDRAGLGQSASPRPERQRTAQSVISDLHDLLTAAAEGGPFILVGHSLGGAFVRLYAVAHPSSLAGLVLVDAVHEREFAAIDELLTPEQRAAGSGMRPHSPEGIDLEAVMAELGAGRSPLDVPLIVVARGRPLADDEMPPSWSPDQRRRREDLRRSLQADLATLSTSGELVVAVRSGHFVHHDKPDVVVSAIRRLVERWRANQNRE
jgi:pimeloyl-ACP methyl ester carboxylesterase